MKYKLVNRDIKQNYAQELLKERGVQDIQKFLNPTPDCLQSWKDLYRMNLAVEFLLANWDKERPISLIVDSDMDGFTSAAIIYLYLKRLNPEAKIDYYLHNGKQHGLQDVWEKMLDKDYSLIIIPDAGSNDGEYVEKLGIPTLVLDHHLVEKAPRGNMVIVNNQTSPDYHNKHLSGAGIAFQFCRALDETLGLDHANEFIDLAAVGVCGDMMSGLEIENQYLWKEGFSNIKNHFLRTIIEKQSYSMDGKINPTTIAFYVVPMVNAMIRVGTQEEKERMFLAFIDGNRKIPSNKRGAKGTEERACVESARECVNARSRQNRILDTAEQKIEMKIMKQDLLENKILFVRLEEDDDFPSELNGLLAMRLSQRHKRPTIVARLNKEGYNRGSMRGISNGPIESFKDFLEESGYFEYVMGL